MGLVQSPLGGLIVAAAGFSLLGITLIWGLSPGHKDRRAQVFAAATSGVLVFLLNLLARATGVWHWYGYQLPLLVQMGMLLAMPAVLVAAVLAGYRRLARRTRRPFLAYALIGLAILVPVTVGGDLYAINRGLISFGPGYTIFHDIVVGQLLWWLPIVLYTWFRRFRASAAA